MKKDTGKLIKTKKGFQVTLPTKKGSANFPIPMAALCFKESDGEDGIEVEVHRDDRNRIVKIIIPGKPEVTPQSAQPTNQKGPRRGDRHGHKAGQHGGSRNHGRQQVSRRTMKKAPPAALGSPFHNPYTFIPFPERSASRHAPTLQTADEDLRPGTEPRYTGIVRLTVTSESPLLTCDPVAIDETDGHKTHQALCIGEDVIVPATGVRGSLRTLMTILTGGTLGYLNTDTYLCQGRDAVLGPRGKNSPPKTPANCFLAEVVRAGNAHRAGVIQPGETRLISVEKLERVEKNLRDHRKAGSKPLYVELNDNGNVKKIYKNKADAPDGVWTLRLSGRPVNRRGKREGLFRACGEVITLPPRYWAEYSERNRHGERQDIRTGDLVWLQPADIDADEIRCAGDILSIQWSRWGRLGQGLETLVTQHAAHVMPDQITDDGLVDMVTDLFGQIPATDSDSKAESSRQYRTIGFAGRVMPENVVFHNAKSKVQRETLAPLAPPHPGCVALNRKNDNPDEVSARDGLPGYKVYRTTNETGADAPWKFSVQGVYDKKGELEKKQNQKVNKTCDLLPAGQIGRLSISFRALTQNELALLLQACDVPWRLGGGKPLGLGLCKIRIDQLLNELGAPLQIPEWQIDGQQYDLEDRPWKESVEEIQSRVAMWIASQRPVDKLRYPRAVSENRNRITRGGHVWFQRHGQPRMVTGKDGGLPEPGLGPMYIDGQLLKTMRESGFEVDNSEPMISGQVLPPLNPEDPDADLLYGHDGFGAKVEHRKRPTRNVYLQYEPFDPTRHSRGS